MEDLYIRGYADGIIAKARMIAKNMIDAGIDRQTVLDCTDLTDAQLDDVLVFHDQLSAYKLLKAGHSLEEVQKAVPMEQLHMNLVYEWLNSDKENGLSMAFHDTIMDALAMEAAAAREE